jgi:hypothetical protein
MLTAAGYEIELIREKYSADRTTEDTQFDVDIDSLDLNDPNTLFDLPKKYGKGWEYTWILLEDEDEVTAAAAGSGK